MTIRDILSLSGGPLPVPIRPGKERELHAGCGGAGCRECRGTGYATMNRVAVDALDRRIAALRLARPDLDPAPHRDPTRPESGPAAETPGGQLGFSW